MFGRRERMARVNTIETNYRSGSTLQPQAAITQGVRLFKYQTGDPLLPPNWLHPSAAATTLRLVRNTSVTS